MAEEKRFIYEFGNFVLVPHERTLLSGGKPVHLPEKEFDTLLMLVKSGGKLLSKDEMMTIIWRDTFVEESNLAQYISRLRKILHTDGQKFIETLPKRGYRFLGDIRRIDGDASLLLHQRVRLTLTQIVEDEPGNASETVDEIHSLAVLPFQPLGSRDEDDFLGLGIADALITGLSRTGQILVRPTSAVLEYMEPGQNSQEIARKLGVDAILEGKLQRLGDKLRLTVQMLRISDGNTLWAESFNSDLEDIFAVQDSIAERVTSALSEKLNLEAQANLKKRYTKNISAYQEYLKGRFFWNKRTVENYEKALVCFQKAIDFDPLYALALAGMADTYCLFAVSDGYLPKDYYSKTKACALRALEIDDSLAEAHVSLGQVFLKHDWNWNGAEISFKHAIKLNPNYAMAHYWLALALWTRESADQAIPFLQKAQELDPLSPVISSWLASLYSYVGLTGEAIAIYLEILRLNPEFYGAYYNLAQTYLSCSKMEKARRACQKAVSLSHGNSLTMSSLAILQARLGEKTAAEKILAKLLEKRKKIYISAVNIAAVFAALGNETNALNWLVKAFSERDPYLFWLKIDPDFKCLHGNPRFQNLLLQIGFN